MQLPVRERIEAIATLDLDGRPIAEPHRGLSENGPQVGLCQRKDSSPSEVRDVGEC